MDQCDPPRKAAGPEMLGRAGGGMACGGLSLDEETTRCLVGDEMEKGVLEADTRNQRQPWRNPP